MVSVSTGCRREWEHWQHKWPQFQQTGQQCRHTHHHIPAITVSINATRTPPPKSTAKAQNIRAPGTKSAAHLRWISGEARPALGAPCGVRAPCPPTGASALVPPRPEVRVRAGMRVQSGDARLAHRHARLAHRYARCASTHTARVARQQAQEESVRRSRGVVCCRCFRSSCTLAAASHLDRALRLRSLTHTAAAPPSLPTWPGRSN
eukprot:2493209-Rhodomonas_salina.1